MQLSESISTLRWGMLPAEASHGQVSDFNRGKCFIGQ